MRGPRNITERESVQTCIMHTIQIAEHEFVLSNEPTVPSSRRRFKKSRGGCAACKKRKVKCGEERPLCYNCSVHFHGSKACEWPEAKTKATRPESSSSSAPSAAVIVHKESISSNLSRKREGDLPTGLGTSTPIGRDVASDLVDPFGVFPQTSVPKAQELLHHYITVAAWEYFPSSRGPKATNPYLASLSVTDPLLFHSNLQVSARSLERRQGLKWSTSSDVVERECVRLLRERVQDPVLSISNHTLGAIARMMEVEHDKGNARAVQMHLDGITSIVKLRGGLDALRRSCTLTMMAVVWRTLLVTDNCPFVPSAKDKLEDPTWLRDILSSAPHLPDLPTSEDLGIDKPSWYGLLAVKRHIQTLEKSLNAGEEPDFTTTESLAGLLWQRCQYLYLAPVLGPLCRAARLVTILFLCISNQNSRSFLFNHPSGLRSCKGISSYVRATLEPFMSSHSRSRLDASSVGTEELSLMLWVFMIAAINACELPDRQWFVDGLVPLVGAMRIGSWKEMKECVKRIMWLDVWHDGVGEKVWEDVRARTREESRLNSGV